MKQLIILRFGALLDHQGY